MNKKFSLWCKKLFALSMAMLLMAWVSDVQAQTKKSRLLFLLDASSSMTYNWTNQETRFDAARKVMLAIMDSMYAVNNEIEFAVRVYGTQSPAQLKNCFDTKLEVDFGLQNINQINTRLKYIKPMGSSPIAFSLQEAADNELSNTNQYDYSFILITDGGESCNGDICDAYSKLVANKVKVTPYIIGLDTNQTLLRYYECLGKYISVTNPKEIANAVKLVLDNNRALLDKRKTLGLKTTYSEVGKLETPEFTGGNINIQYLTPISNTFRYSSLIRMPRAYIIRKRNTIPIDQLVSVEAKPFITAELLSGAPARRISFTFTRPLPSVKYKLLPTASASSLVELSAKPNIAIESLVSTMASISKRKEREPKPAKSIKPLPWTIPNFDISKEAINIAAIDGAPRRLSFSIKETKPNLPKRKNNIAISIPQFDIAQQEIGIGKLGSVAPVFVYMRNDAKPNLPKQRKLGPTLMPDFEITKPYIEAALINGIASRINTTPTTLNKVVGKMAKLGKPAAIEFEPPKDMEAIAISAIWQNQFKMGYTPNRPTPRKPIRPTPRKLFIPNYVTKASTATNTPVAKNEEPEYKIESVASNETKIQVYFTDGMGKFYKTKPDVVLVDALTKETKKTFVRTVSMGEPDPIKLDFDGKFDISILGQKDIVLHNVEIPKNKTTKVYLKVENGTLVFTYSNNRNRPVEFDALVFVRNKSKAPTPMKCSELKMFEPGDYHIEIDVLPKYAVTTEISFGATTEIQIPQLGQVNFLNMEQLGEVRLYAERGDHFEYFHTIIVDGNMPKQKIQLRPGLYQASWIPPGSPQGTRPIVMKFLIKSNLITEAELKFIGDNAVTPEGTGRLLFTDASTPNINIQLDKKK
jgi:hypothetical protein